MVEDPEHDFLGAHKDKVWTYLILLFVLLGIVIAINFVWKNPTSASSGMHYFLGQPSWVLALVLAAGGALIYWLGLKVEPDWPEALGAAMISGSVAWGEWIVGWAHFDFGGLAVIPYLIPLAVFLLLLVYAVRNSR
jgi:hypothetical protein